MRKLSFLAALAVLTLLVSGCDDENTKEAKVYDRQLALNDGDYAKVLELTESCGSDQACWMDRAAAYIGRAGFSISTVIVGLTSENGGEEFYTALGRSASATAADDLAGAKTIYETIITGTGAIASVCDKTNPLYEAAGYYGQASCFNHGMTVMASTAVLMDKLDQGLPADAQDVADLLNDDLDSLINLYGGEESATTEEVNAIKEDICGLDLVCDAAEVNAYVAAH